MPVLAYCLSELQSIAIPEKGVGELAVESLEQDGIRCFFSRSNSRDQILGPPARATALAFHNVITSVFRQVAVIPFRFPTILEDEAELRSHLTQQESTYREALMRLRNLVQMELHLLPKPTFQEKQGTEEMPANLTGTGYLRARQVEQRKLAELSAALRQSGGSLIRDWRERPSAHGLRCFSLIERQSVGHFNDLIMTTQVAPELSARVSGPWPASEFIEQS
jgi:Gas vesicle synthesis protein GvpL/GvpF